MKGIGVDMIEIHRIQKAVKKQSRFLAKYFTKDENKLFIMKNYLPQTIAGNFCAKEAVAKALGTGFRKFSPIDIEVLRNEQGQPYIKLYGEAEKRKDELGIEKIWISISHCQQYAIAYVVAE
ncbi:MAG: holo-ACP synthase [Epulopiscium sp.]|nr:holo-ACP synthase [Candidatus Epulonipiscium sp.]